MLSGTSVAQKILVVLFAKSRTTKKQERKGNSEQRGGISKNTKAARSSRSKISTGLL